MPDLSFARSTTTQALLEHFEWFVSTGNDHLVPELWDDYSSMSIDELIVLRQKCDQALVISIRS